jgi:hypothetical protein
VQLLFEKTMLLLFIGFDTCLKFIDDEIYKYDNDETVKVFNILLELEETVTFPFIVNEPVP